MITEWFQSEGAIKRYLRSLGLRGENGRIFRDGVVLRAGNLYGMYSKRSWFIRLEEVTMTIVGV